MDSINTTQIYLNKSGAKASKLARLGTTEQNCMSHYVTWNEVMKVC